MVVALVAAVSVILVLAVILFAVLTRGDGDDAPVTASGATRQQDAASPSAGAGDDSTAPAGQADGTPPAAETPDATAVPTQSPTPPAQSAGQANSATGGASASATTPPATATSTAASTPTGTSTPPPTATETTAPTRTTTGSSGGAGSGNTPTATYTATRTPTKTATPTYTPSPTYTPTYTPTATYTPTPPPTADPGDTATKNLTIPLDKTVSVTEFVSHPGGDTTDKVAYSVSGMNPTAGLSGGRARLVISASCFSTGVEHVQFFTGGQTYSCGQTLVDREVTADSDTGTVTINAIGGASTYVQWVLTGTATRVN